MATVAPSDEGSSQGRAWLAAAKDRARNAIAGALDDWAEREAIAQQDEPRAFFAPQDAANELSPRAAAAEAAAARAPWEYGQTGEPEPWDAAAQGDANLGLTRDVISTWERYHKAAQRVAESLVEATYQLDCAIDRLGGVWSAAGIIRRQKLAAKIKAHRAREERILACTSGKVGVPMFRCEGCGSERKGVPMGCNARICPRCAPKLRRANQAKIMDVLAAVDDVRKRKHKGPARWRFVTLTVRSQNEFVPMRRFVGASWGKLIRRAWWKRTVGACIAFFETTHTAAGWHVHVHALVDAFVDRQALVRAWGEVTNGAGEAAGVHVSLPKGDRLTIVRELAKYAAKDLGGVAADDGNEWGVAGTGKRLAEFYLGSLRWRTLRTYGDAYDAARWLDDQKIEAAMLCEECGREMTYDRVRWVAARELVLEATQHRHRPKVPT